MKIRHKAGAMLTLALSLAAADAFEMPSAARFQQVLARQVDQEADDRFAVIAVYPGEAGRILGQALLAQLGRQPSYLADMQRWIRHHHTVFGGAVAFLADGQVTLRWQLRGENAIAALDRSVCRSLSAAARTAAVARERADLIGRHKEALAATLATAYARTGAPAVADRRGPCRRKAARGAGHVGVPGTQEEFGAGCAAGAVRSVFLSAARA